EGKKAREVLERARERCARVLGLPPESVFFTSGGTESNAIVIQAQLLRRYPLSILSSAVEHPSVRENCLCLEGLGKQIGFIGVEKDGRVSPRTLEKALAKYPNAGFAAIMAVNNETGAVNDMASLSGVLRSRAAHPVHLHCDLVQALGKTAVDIRAWDLDSASVSAHKLGGPRGIGLLYLRKPLQTLSRGGGQERGIRPGTENVSGAAALADRLEKRASAEAVHRERDKARSRWKRLITALSAHDRCTLIPEDRTEDDERFSPWILQAAFKGLPGEVMVRALDDRGFAVSTGSACSSSSRERPVLAAMGVSPDLSLNGIRISQGWSTDEASIEKLIEAVSEILRRYR
ncbi:MAG: aminotransferase class V-fold PLP-dependent enzyme, partial [Spirochaetaceae bacterium]|nr:aminotransferase class V-fold PLP-dependent enzyme [Spirochaetaceae bacterium]